jgi:hypothetical protein
VNRLILVIPAVITTSFFLPPSSQAGQRHYAYSYETLTAAKGSIELEQWVTWRHRDVPGGDDRDRWEFRHEVEFGLTDRLQLDLYLADWQYDDDDEGHEFRYQASGAEVIYNLTNPNTDFLGSALYAELLIGDELIKAEAKLLLEKRFGKLGFVYNAILEAEWEGEDYDEETGEFEQTFGVSYDISKSFSVGLEALHAVEIPEWEDTAPAEFYIGPNVSYRHGRFFATLAWLWQTTHLEGEPDFRPRLICGFEF